MKKITAYFNITEWHKLTFCLFLTFVLSPYVLDAQEEENQVSEDIDKEIVIKNASFEGIPQCCATPNGWIDCGFKGETPTDIQPALDANEQPLFGVTNEAHSGNTYIGMVLRDNDTYERIAQRLTKPMKKGKCYSFSVYLATSLTFKSASNEQPTILKQFNTPIVLQIWGGENLCKQVELLAQSNIISNTEWQRFDFEFIPKQDLTIIELSAFYPNENNTKIRGNILVDTASNIIENNCEN